MNQFSFNALLLSLLFLAQLSYSENREWTNAKGQKIVGSLTGMTATEIQLTTNSTAVAVPISSLSKPDQDYIAKRRKDWPVKLDAKTVRVVSNESGKKVDRRKLDVEVSDVSGRTLKVLVVWIGDGGNSDKYGVYKSFSEKIQKDGNLQFKVAYWGKRKFAKNYRGYAVRVTDETGEVLAETASQKPFVRFLPQQK